MNHIHFQIQLLNNILTIKYDAWWSLSVIQPSHWRCHKLMRKTNYT